MTRNAGIEASLDFLRELRSHNDRAWFEANRERYGAARAAFEALVEVLIAGIRGFEELGATTAKDCVFRINRDVRFSADKSPYKTSMGALIGPEGRKSGVRSYYLHLEPGASMLAGGFHSPSPADLGALREAIARDARPLRKALDAPAFVREFGALSGEELKTAPRGFAADHPAIALLRKKQFLAVHPLGDRELSAPDFAPRALATFAAMRPFLLVLESMRG